MDLVDRQEHFVREGNDAGRVSIGFTGGILCVTVENDASGDNLFQAFRKGLEAGRIGTDVPSLVDLTRFTGTIDWTAVWAVRRLAPWGEGPGGPGRTAYLVRDSYFVALVRIAGAIFNRSQHRIFADPALAMDWLQAAPEHPSPSF